MQITSAQCRAARSLLEWTQDELAAKARVSRATIADFETNSRQPIKNNLIAIEDCMFSAGVEFLPEDGKAGVGVRFRERQLEYTSNVRINRFDRFATMNMRYAGSPFTCVIPLTVIDDFHRSYFNTDKEYGKAISEILHQILAAVERQAKDSINGDSFIVTYEMLDPSTR
jgi:transcriptional regulator with XRE-family HTH domain